MTVTTLERAQALLATLREEASDHTRHATEIGAHLAEQAPRLEAKAREERELSARLEALRTDLANDLAAKDTATDKRDRHLAEADAVAAAADYYEATTIPTLARLLEPDPLEAPPAGPEPPPRDETALVPPADGLPSTGRDWLTSGSPLTTRTDMSEPETDEPRHAKPRPRVDMSGAFKAITGRLTTLDTPEDDR